jgi:hypothetical protein
MTAEEHFGVNQRERWQIAQFQDVVEDCGLNDLGFNGLPFTWDNYQEGDYNVKVRLDRALGDVRFVECMGGTRVTHVPTVFSDHSAILVELKKNEVLGRCPKKRKPFRYENMWQRHEAYTDFVKQSWESTTN